MYQQSSTSTPVLVLQPSKGLVQLKLGEVWAYRELLFFLIWRDVKVRYKQTALGAAWAILQPVMTMVVFSVFFGRLGEIPYDGSGIPLEPSRRRTNGSCPDLCKRSANGLVGARALMEAT